MRYLHRILFWPRDEINIAFRDLEMTLSPSADGRVNLGGSFVVDE